MKKRIKSKKPSSVPPRLEPDANLEPDIALLLNKMQQQLTFLEKKIDTLIGKSSEKPFEVQYSSRPVQRSGHSYHHDKAGQDNRFRERHYTQAICADCKKECEVPFKPTGDRPVYCKECFSKRKNGSPFKEKYDHRPREEGFARERHFDKHQGDGHRRSGGRKKPNFRKRK